MDDCGSCAEARLQYMSSHTPCMLQGHYAKQLTLNLRRDPHPRLTRVSTPVLEFFPVMMQTQRSSAEATAQDLFRKTASWRVCF